MCYSYLVIRALFDSARVRDPRKQSLRTIPKDTRLKLDLRSDSSKDDCPYPLSAPYVRALSMRFPPGQRVITTIYALI